jgi:hypothetical protein
MVLKPVCKVTPRKADVFLYIDNLVVLSSVRVCTYEHNEDVLWACGMFYFAVGAMVPWS